MLKDDVLSVVFPNIILNILNDHSLILNKKNLLCLLKAYSSCVRYDI